MNKLNPMLKFRYNLPNYKSDKDFTAVEEALMKNFPTIVNFDSFTEETTTDNETKLIGVLTFYAPMRDKEDIETYLYVLNNSIA